MAELTFGFMDPSCSDRENADLFARLRGCAITSFRRESVADLSSFGSDSLEESNVVIAKDIGPAMGDLRDGLYDHARTAGISLRFPDVQSCFLYAFTRGVNQFSFGLMDPDDIPEPARVSIEQVLARRFPILGPQWLCNAANREMPTLENVFCGLQDEVLVPAGRTCSARSGRILADAIAGTFLWGFFGGTYWLREAIREIAEPYVVVGSGLGEGAVCQVKRSMQFLDGDDISRVLAFAPVMGT